VGLAVRAESPVVLSHGHRVDVRPSLSDAERPCGHLLDQVADLLELRAQMVVYVDQMLTGRQLVRRVRAPRFGGGTRGSLRLVEQLYGASPYGGRWSRHDCETTRGCTN